MVRYALSWPVKPGNAASIFASAILSLISAAYAAPTQEDVFKSIHENVGKPVDLKTQFENWKLKYRIPDPKTNNVKSDRAVRRAS